MTILSLASLPQTSQWSVNSSKIDQLVTLFLGWRKVCLLQKTPQTVFSRLVPIRCCIITSWFAIVLSEIRTGQILREKLDCKQSIATCISGCALFFSHYFLLMCLHFLYQKHNKDCCLFVCTTTGIPLWGSWSSERNFAHLSIWMWSLHETVCTLQRMMTRTTPKGHFTVMDEIEAEGDLVLIQTFLLYYVNQVILMLNTL